MLAQKRPDLLNGCLPMVLAGGRGKRLYELTEESCKPALPFGAGGQRLVDFTLASLRAAGFTRAIIATQYRPAPLIRHLRDKWADAFPDGLLIRDATRLSRGGYRGTAHALLANLDLLEREGVNDVLVMPADQICDIDLRPFIQRHRLSDAPATLVAATLSSSDAEHHSVLEVARDGHVSALTHRPSAPAEIGESSGRSLVATGIYLFKTAWLRKELPELSRGRFDISIETDLLEAALREKALQAYRLPRSDAGREAYWRDIDTLDDYRSALLDFAAPQGGTTRGSPPLSCLHLEAQPGVIGVGRRSALTAKGAVSRDCHLTDTLLAPDVSLPAGTIVEGIGRTNMRWFRRSGDTNLITQAMVDRSRERLH
ncbi:sugar phosphate nucleotidyltransferase [Thioclava sp. F36-7]|uniref:sugar phosphate nucleotidyltransferase n=1 Tax=Thioclava sp. F36-7 TaxID=1915317 RepID=UPI00143948A4|nr:sugar phosphate nucleotidyltransferase [Thioclava sp. F36-7]